MKQILLIRHGHAEHLNGELTGGWTDTNLTELGQQQVKALAARLKNELTDTPHKLYCSDLKRATQTAQIIGEALGIKPVPLPCLREINNGIAKDMTREEARKHYRELTEPTLDWQAYPGAETWRQFHNRIAHCMDSIVEDEVSLIIVTHGGPIVHVIDWWLQLDIETVSRVYFDTDPASISLLTTNNLGDRVLSRLNDTAHLKL
jgi:probable phosphoglycerate mutase